MLGITGWPLDVLPLRIQSRDLGLGLSKSTCSPETFAFPRRLPPQQIYREHLSSALVLLGSPLAPLPTPTATAGDHVGIQPHSVPGGGSAGRRCATETRHVDPQPWLGCLGVI